MIFTKTIIEAVKYWINSKLKKIEVNINELDQKIIDITFDNNDALEFAAETGLVEPAAADDGAIFVDENGIIYTLD